MSYEDHRGAQRTSRRSKTSFFHLPFILLLIHSRRDQTLWCIGGRRYSQLTGPAASTKKWENRYNDACAQENGEFLHAHYYAVTGGDYCTNRLICPA